VELKSGDYAIQNLVRNVKHEEKFNYKQKKSSLWENLENMGRFNAYNVIELGPFEGIDNVWKDQPCFVVGAGRSLRGFDFSQLDGLNTIGINHVIEDYDRFKWFMFLDDRFLMRTTYDIKNYTGKIFASSKCRMLPQNDCVRFKPKTSNRAVSTKIENGLWNNRMTGIAALNLAIITGANPIYLLGFDCGTGEGSDYHYKKDYTAADQTEERREKYVNSARFFDKFEPWKDRIINCSLESNITTFKKMPFKKIKLKPAPIKKEKIEISRDPVICHVGTMQNIDQMGTISRTVYNETIGKHIYTNIESDKIPNADIYLLECFINGAKRYEEFKAQNNGKIISLIHSSSSCRPSIYSDQVVNISYTWKGIWQSRGIDSRMIYAGIDTKLYDCKKDYTKKTFGRITRYSRGKVHPEWNNIIGRVLDKYKDSRCYMISNNYPEINQKRLNIIRDIKINEEERKAKYLAKINLFADAHNTFKETFSLCLLEAMASGCAIVLLRGQNAMEEILGNSGYICTTIKEFEDTIIKLLPDSEKMRELGLLAKSRAKDFETKTMIKKWNQLFKDMLNG
jgi:hypothetical protein